MKEKKMIKITKCGHCGGPMRFYRDGISCLMCGRSTEHSCERCIFPKTSEVMQGKAAA